MSDLNHYMVDIETTGTDPKHTNMIQLACVRFNPYSAQVDPNMFCASIEEQPGRYWDQSTRGFWAKRPNVLEKIQAAAIPAPLAMQAFQDWVLKVPVEGERVFWAKPSSFDFPFVEEYFMITGIMSPFHYRTVMDMRSFTRAVLGHTSFGQVEEFEKTIQFQGIEHDARFDALHQVRIVLEALKRSKVPA